MRPLKRRIKKLLDGGIYLGRCEDLLAWLPNEHVDLTITSPPYYIGKEYDTSRRVSEFEDLLEVIAPELERTTKTGGNICLQLGYHNSGRGLTPLDYVAHCVIKSTTTFRLRNRIIWTFGSGPHASKRFSGRHEVVLWYSKGESSRFDLDAVRIPQKYPGKRHYKGNKRGTYSSNPLGKNPSDVWEIPQVHSSHPEKTVHPCQFPIALAVRLVRALTAPGDLILDPFAGVGSTGAAAILEKRRFLGAELSEAYAKIACSRIRAATDGTIPYRPLEQPILDPSTQGAVAKPPKQGLKKKALR